MPQWHVLLALLQLPAADARHAAGGIDPAISVATWRDLGAWCEQFRTRFGVVGSSLEILAWAQSYLRGGVLRVGAVQWELRAFARPILALRRARTGELRVVAAARAGCTLFTNLANPTSNAIYERIGYRRIGSAYRYAFTSA